MPLKQTTLRSLWATAAPREEEKEEEETAVSFFPQGPTTGSSARSDTSAASAPAASSAAGPAAPNPGTGYPASPSYIKEPASNGDGTSNGVGDSTIHSARPIQLPAQATIEPLTQHNLLAFRRLIKTLLPVRYPDKTYAAILANEAQNQIARVLLWHDPRAKAAACSSEASRGIVVGAICARIQPVSSAGADPAPTGDGEVYVQMLGVLAPYRDRGLASALLTDAMRIAAARYGVRQVMAHVWEKHDDALQWYIRRGFVVEDQILKEYYQQLRPRGAWVVRRRIGVLDFV